MLIVLSILLFLSGASALAYQVLGCVLGGFGVTVYAASRRAASSWPGLAIGSFIAWTAPVTACAGRSSGSGAPNCSSAPPPRPARGHPRDSPPGWTLLAHPFLLPQHLAALDDHPLSGASPLPSSLSHGDDGRAAACGKR